MNLSQFKMIEDSICWKYGVANFVNYSRQNVERKYRQCLSLLEINVIGKIEMGVKKAIATPQSRKYK